MHPPTASGIDWRDAAVYAPLLEADRSLCAWEWLRRDPRYIAAAENPGRHGRGVGQLAAEFGLVALEPPSLAVPRARPLWTADAHPYVLSVTRGDKAAAPDDWFDLERFAAIATRVEDEDGEHLLLCDGFHAVRLDGAPGTFAMGRICLRYFVEGVASARPPLLTLRRFLALCGIATFSRSLHPREPRARRWVLMLRAYDALAHGTDQREIARELLSRSAGEPRWRSREPSVRTQAQRLVRSVRGFSAGGYRTLLR